MKIIDFPLTCHRHGPILTNVMPGAIESCESLFLEMMDCEDVGEYHDHHGDVEGQQRAKDQEVLVVHLTHFVCRHEVLHVEDGECWDGGSKEEAEAPGQNNFVEYGVFALCPLAQRSSDPSVTA